MLSFTAVFSKVFDSFLNQRIKFKILSLYLTIIILSIGTVSWIIYVSTEKQLKYNVYQITDNAVNQISHNISDKLSIVAEQLIKLKSDMKLEHLVDTRNSGMSEQESAEAVIYFKKIFDEMYSFGNNYELIHSMVIYLDNGMRFQFEEGKYFFLNEKLSGGKIRQYCNGDQNYIWRNSHKDRFFFEGSGAKVLSISTPVRHGEKIAALIVINLNESYLKRLIEGARPANTGSVVVISRDGYLTSRSYQHSVELESMLNDRVLHNSRESDQFDYKLKKSDFLVVYDTIRVNGWKLAMILKKSDLMRSVDRTKFEIIGFTLIVIFIAVIAAFLIAEGLTKPMYKLSKLMAVAETGNLDIRFNTKYNDEIGMVTRQFNVMLERIKLLIRKVEEEQTQKRRLEFKALQMQINPHFLYNTLDSIKFLAEQRDEKAGVMARALGQFYKYGLCKGDGLTTVGEEIDHLKSYLTIQKIRYSSRFDYRIAVDDSLLSCRTVMFILQPLVENSIYHGIRRKHGKGVISIKGHREENLLVITVHDNGAGMAPERLEMVRKNLRNSQETDEVGIGVFNVNKRITMYYGEEYGITITSVENEFTLVTVKHPVKVQALEE
jgi:two-component system sensor histidine kinase YesM